MSMNDNRGCSVCPAGSENYEIFTTRLRGKRVKRVQYDYRTPDGGTFRYRSVEPYRVQTPPRRVAQ